MILNQTAMRVIKATLFLKKPSFKPLILGTRQPISAFLLMFLFLCVFERSEAQNIYQLLQQADINVTPSPIPVQNGNATFKLNVSLPAYKSLKKLDSITYKVSYEEEGQYLEIGSASISLPDKRNQLDKIESSANFSLSNGDFRDNTPVYLQIILFKKGKSKRTERLMISRFVLGTSPR